MPKKRSFAMLFLIALCFTASACSEDGGKDDHSRRPSGLLKGRVVDAAVANGQVSIFSFAEGRPGELLGSGTTDAEGNYEIAITSPDQPILIEVTGGTYIEEASGRTVFLGEGKVLRAVAFYQSGSAITTMVTPFTHIAAGLTEHKMSQGASPQAAITEAVAAITSMTGADILTTKPLDMTDSRNLTQRLTQEHLYGLWTAAISSWTAEASAKNGNQPHETWNSIGFAQIAYNDIASDGLLDGRGKDLTGKLSDLGFGLVSIDANTFRAEFARHMVKMVGSDLNKTGITLQQALPYANALALTTHQVFGALEPEPLDTEGPVITPIDAEGLFYAGAITFSVNASDSIEVKSVSFTLDESTALGEAADPKRPSISINTTLFSDGPHTIGVDAVDHLGNRSFRQLQVNFANGGAFVNVTSPTITNRSPFTLSGTYRDPGPGIRSIVVQQQPAAIGEDNTWSAQVTLTPPFPGESAAFSVDVPIVITDNLGVSRTSIVKVKMETVAPALNPEYSSATFVSGSDTFTESLAFANQEEIPLRIDTNHVDLNGIPVFEGALDANLIPFIIIRVNDPVVNSISTPQEEIEVSLQYSLAGTVLTSWHRLSPRTGTGGFRYVIPLVSEFLHPDWITATPEDQHVIEVKAKDAAGNETAFRFRFFVQFVTPTNTASAVDINTLNASFANRASLYNIQTPTTQYSFTNSSNRSILTKLLDPSIHSVSNIVEQAIREHLAMPMTIESWQASFRFSLYSSCSGVRCPPPTLVTNPNEPWQEITVLKGYTGRTTNTGFPLDPPNFISPPAPTFGGQISLSSDAFPSPSETAWANFHPYSDWQNISRNYYSTNNNSFAFDRSVGQNHLQKKTIFTHQSVPGYPRNNYSTFIETQSFSTSQFIVEKDGTRLVPIEGWYRIPAGATVTIKKFVSTPSLNIYNDTDVGNPASFGSYNLRKYDKTITWSINHQLQISSIVDVGFERASQMTALTTHATLGVGTYTIGR